MANANGSDTPNGGDTGTPGTADAPKFITEDDLDTKLNAAISGHLRRHAKAFDDAIAKRLDEFRASIAPPPGDPPGDAPKPPPGKSPEVAALERRLADFEKALTAERSARAEAEHRSRAERARRELDEVIAAKVRPEMRAMQRRLI